MVGFPLLLIPLAVYNIIVFLMPGVSLTEPLFRLTLMSGADWPITLSEILLALGMVLLLLEVIKGARPGAKFLMDHLLSFVVFCAAAAEFVLWPKFASSTYFLLTLLALVDFISGIALRAHRSPYYAPASAPSRRAARPAETPPAAPRVEPEPAAPTPASPPPAVQAAPASAAPPAPAPTPVPSATPVAESVLQEHPDPRPTQQPAPGAPEASPQVVAPELQPNGSAPASPEPPQR